MYCLPNPIVIPDSPHFAGCRTWVDLPSEPPLSTAGLMPVVTDNEFARQRQAIQAAVQFAIA
jgi:hypothetical protein